MEGSSARFAGAYTFALWLGQTALDPRCFPILRRLLSQPFGEIEAERCSGGTKHNRANESVWSDVDTTEVCHPWLEMPSE